MTSSVGVPFQEIDEELSLEVGVCLEVWRRVAGSAMAHLHADERKDSQPVAQHSEINLFDAHKVTLTERPESRFRFRFGNRDTQVMASHWLAMVRPYGRAVHALKPGTPWFYCTDSSEKWSASSRHMTIKPLDRTEEPTCHHCRRVLELDA